MDKEELFYFDLQCFADDGGNGDGSKGDGGGADGGNGADSGSDDGNSGGDNKTFSQDDVNRILGERLSQAQAKWEKDLQAKLEAAKTEAEKLAKMNADQKAEYEKQKREDALKKREETLQQRERDISLRELRATALGTLAEKGMPEQLADLLNYTDAESTSKSIETVEKIFRTAVEAGVNERLKGNTPKGGGKSYVTGDEISKIFAQR